MAVGDIRLSWSSFSMTRVSFSIVGAVSDMGYWPAFRALRWIGVGSSTRSCCMNRLISDSRVPWVELLYSMVMVSAR